MTLLSFKTEDPKNHRPVILTSIHRKVMEQLISETISRHMKGKKVIRTWIQNREVMLDQPDNTL